MHCNLRPPDIAQVALPVCVSARVSQPTTLYSDSCSRPRATRENVHYFYTRTLACRILNFSATLNVITRH